MTATTGCQTCGGYGDKHDLGVHFDSGEDVRVTYAEEVTVTMSPAPSG